MTETGSSRVLGHQALGRLADHSTYDTVLNLYRRTDSGDLRLVSCDDDSGGNLSSALVHQIEGGTRYGVMVADCADGTTSATLALQAKSIPYRR